MRAEMNAQSTPFSIADTLAALQARRSSLAWAKRQKLAEQLRPELEAARPSEDALALVELLAADPKPEVRQSVAALLHLLPADRFEPLSEHLKEDSNAYVRNAAERAVKRRREAKRREGKVRFSTDEIVKQLRAIEHKHGSDAARDSWKLCEQYMHRVVNSMVHDLRGLLTHLKTNIATASDRQGKDRISAMARAKDDVAFLERTVQDMEWFTQTIRGRRGRRRLRLLVERGLEMARNAIRENGEIDPTTVDVEVQVAEDIVVKAREHLIASALANILKNAYESFVGPGGDQETCKITITAGARGDTAELTIVDNGMGFSQEEADALSQSTPGRRNKTKHNSTGYGLPNAIRNIAAHKGTINIVSQEGVGTTVKVRLPIEQKE